MGKVIFILSIFVTSLSFGTESAERALLQLEEVQRAMHAMGMAGQAQCDLNIPSTCHFQSFCSVLAPHRAKSYVYENKEGRKFANFNLLFLQDQLELCLAANGRKANREEANDSDPFANPHLLVGEDREQHLPRFKKEETRVFKLAEEIRKDLTNLLAKRRTAKNSAMIDNMISRVQRVKWEVVLPSSSEELFESGCYLPNARFKPRGNKVLLCPQVLGMPEGTLTMILAHELGHAIDPCMASQTIIELGGEETVLGSDNDGRTHLLKSVPPSRNPLDSVIQCLRSPQSLGVKIRNNAEKARDLRAYIDGLVAEGIASSPGDLIAAQNKLKEYENPRSEEDYCAEGLHDSGAYYMQEAFSDWVSAEILAERVGNERDPAKARSFVFESQLLGLQSECAGFSQDQKEMITTQLKAAGCKSTAVDALFSLDQGQGTDDHPSWSQRMSKIYLAQPALQKTLRCQAAKNTKNCE